MVALSYYYLSHSVLGTALSKIGLDQLCLLPAPGASDTRNGSNRLLHLYPPWDLLQPDRPYKWETSTPARWFTAKTSEFDYAWMARGHPDRGVSPGTAAEAPVHAGEAGPGAKKPGGRRRPGCR